MIFAIAKFMSNFQLLLVKSHKSINTSHTLFLYYSTKIMYVIIIIFAERR